MKKPNCAYGHWDCMPCIGCDAFIPTQTNADRIRAMSDEELASFIVDWDCHMCVLWGRKCDEQCEKYLIEWLRQPAEEGT